MPALLELQRAFAAGLTSGDSTAIASMIAGGSIGPEARLRIHRRTMDAALAGALKLTYPAIEALVGAEFFTQAAIAFAHAAPPRRAILADYGGGFPEFLADYLPVDSLSYLADVARLEWQVSRTACAPDADEGAGISADLAGVTLTLAPSLALLRVDFPAEAIWRAVVDGDEASLSGIDPSPNAGCVAVWREGDGAAVASLGKCAAMFATRLLEGADAETALSDAALADPAADPIAAISAEILHAGFARLTPVPQPNA